MRIVKILAGSAFSTLPILIPALLIGLILWLEIGTIVFISIVTIGILLLFLSLGLELTDDGARWPWE